MKRPLFIYFLTLVCGAFAIGFPIAIVVELLDGGTFYSFNGKSLTKEGFVLAEGIRATLLWIISCIASWGFWNRISWSRHLVIVLAFVLPVLYILIFEPFTLEVFGSFLGMLLFYWYLFIKTNVVDYFEYDYNKARQGDASHACLRRYV